MLKKICIDEAEGKVVRKITPFGTHLAVTFTDDPFVFFGLDLGYERGEEEIVEEDECDPDPDRYSDNPLESGIWSEIDIGEARRQTEERERKRAEADERQQRQTYERLKKKYEPVPVSSQERTP